MNYLIDVQAKEVPCLKVTFLIMSACKKSFFFINFQFLFYSVGLGTFDTKFVSRDLFW